MVNPWQWWPMTEIARVTQCPPHSVALNWPLIAEALDRRGLWDRDIARGVLATVAIETASTFEPIHEYGTEADWARYGGGARYAGRGFIQLTHDYNYRAAGQVVNVNLLNDPDRALEPSLAAEILAWYWATKTIPAADQSRSWTLAQLCREHDWEWVRRAVQGGTAGLDRLLQIVNDLGDVQNMPGIIPFNPDAPIDVQPNDWSCSLQSIQWLLRSIGRNPDAKDPTGDPWLMSQLVPAVISPSVGLLNASGKGLCDWLNREYGVEMGFLAGYGDVTFDDVKAGAGANPTIVGGRHYGPGGHWVGVRRVLPDGSLELANPAPNYTNTGPSLDRAEWDARGPWSAVWIDRLAMGAGQPPVVVPPDQIPAPSRASVLLSEIEARLIELKGLVA